MSKRTILILAGIVILAAGLRFWALDRIPPGVYPDEAINGVEGLQAAETGEFKLFYTTNMGREGLWINLIGIGEKFMGISQLPVLGGALRDPHRARPVLFGARTFQEERPRGPHRRIFPRYRFLASEFLAHRLPGHHGSAPHGVEFLATAFRVASPRITRR